MTNFEYMKTLPDEASFVRWLSSQYHGVCYTRPHSHCIQDEYRGDKGCERCHADWLKSEMEL